MEAETEEESGWDFWGRVYEDPKLRAEVRAENQDEPTIAEILGGEKIQRTKIIVENLPKKTTEADLKNLMEAEIGSATIMRINMGKQNSSMIEFYLESNAKRAVNVFNDRKLRGQLIKVTAAEDMIDEEEEEEEEEWDMTHDEEAGGSRASGSRESDRKIPDKLPLPPPIPNTRPGFQTKFNADSRPSWFCSARPSVPGPANRQTEPIVRVVFDPEPSCLSNLQGLGISDMETLMLQELVQTLSEFGPLLYFGEQIRTILCKEKYRDLDLYNAWPLGAFRRQRAEFKLFGPFLSLESDQGRAMQLCGRAHKAYIEVEPWETQSPQTINDITSFYEYLKRFLEHWGPCWEWDSKLQLVMELLPPSFVIPDDVFTGRTAMQMNIYRVHHTLFLVSIPAHMERLRALIRTDGD